ncbi:MAG: cyanophycin synthetase, partial [Candidatus Wolfebacteria bacterium]|nr:cyanophycin synthetase [Candidatus Wolfebacteria bacterium]
PISLCVVLDGAHNPAKIQALVQALRSFFSSASRRRKFIFIFAAKKTKDYETMLKKIIPLAKRIYFSPFKATTDYGKRQSVPPREMAKFVKTIWDGECKIARNSKEVIQKVLKTAKEGDIIVVTGSLYLVGEIRSIMKIRAL